MSHELQQAVSQRVHVIKICNEIDLWQHKMTNWADTCCSVIVICHSFWVRQCSFKAGTWKFDLKYWLRSTYPHVLTKTWSLLSSRTSVLSRVFLLLFIYFLNLAILCLEIWYTEKNTDLNSSNRRSGARTVEPVFSLIFGRKRGVGLETEIRRRVFGWWAWFWKI